MNKAVDFAILYVTLFVFEILIVFVSLVLIDLFQYGFDIFFIKGAWRASVLWNYWILLFYGIPLVILFFLLFEFVANIKLYKPLLFSLFNLLIYVSSSILTRVVVGSNVPLPPEGVMFWTTCIAIFLSPLILGQMPYFEKILNVLLPPH